jgi:UDP-N-acetylglucosamine--dolichyl-phosphate N-acetylglucosaminephosphotransferase
MLITVALSLLSFLLTFIFIKRWIPLAKKKGILGIDVHKPNKPIVTEAGGTIFLLSITISLLLYGLWLTIGNTPDFRFFAILSSVLIGGILGLQDHLVEIRWRNKIFLPLIIAIPLMIARVGHTTIDIPFFGVMDLGNVYTFLLIPLVVTGLVNMVNMFAGYNGLEAGLGAINAFWFLIVSYMIGNQLTFLISAALLASLLAFLRFNWYPAKVFPGDVGTFTIGAVLISIAIVGNMEKFALGLFSLYLINFLLLVYWLKFTNKPFKKFADVDKNGYIKPPNPYTLYWMLPYYFKLKEKTTVKALLLLQFLVGLLSFLFFIKL